MPSWRREIYGTDSTGFLRESRVIRAQCRFDVFLHLARSAAHKFATTTTMHHHQTLVIVGSGPIGMTAALQLSPYFSKVILLERQSKHNFLEENGYTFPFSLTPAAEKVMEKVKERSPCYTLDLHYAVKGIEFPIGHFEQNNVYAFWRHHVITTLYKACVEVAEIRFDTSIESIDFDKSTTLLTDGTTLDFDLLLGADGVHSQTRQLLAETLPQHKFGCDALQQRWVSFTPSVDWWSESDADIFVRSNIPGFSVAASRMKNPDQVALVNTYPHDWTIDQAKQASWEFLSRHMDRDTFEKDWQSHCAGQYDHVTAGQFHQNRVLLVGDAAHGFMSAGDSINLSICSIGELAKRLEASKDIPQVLQDGVAEVGDALRYYNGFAKDRASDALGLEMMWFSLLKPFVCVHPLLYGVYANDFELVPYIESYRSSKKLIRKFQAALLILAVIFAVLAYTNASPVYA